MTDKEILQKAVIKAVKNGMIWGDWDSQGFLEYWNSRDFEDIIEEREHYKLIFSHEFAKAFWGDEKLSEGKTLDETYEELKEHYLDKDDFEFDWISECNPEEAWEYHLKQMVLEKEPLKYIERFL